MAFELKIANRLLKGNDVVYEYPSDDPDTRCWILVSGLTNNEYHTNIREIQFNVMVRVFKADFIREHPDIENWPDYEIDRPIWGQHTYDELMEFFEMNNINSKLFTEPWKTDYPLC